MPSYSSSFWEETISANYGQGFDALLTSLQKFMNWLHNCWVPATTLFIWPVDIFHARISFKSTQPFLLVYQILPSFTVWSKTLGFDHLQEGIHEILRQHHAIKLFYRTQRCVDSVLPKYKPTGGLRLNERFELPAKNLNETFRTSGRSSDKLVLKIILVSVLI